MKISEMITEDIVKEIIPESKRHEFLGIKNQDYDGHIQYLDFKEYEYGGDRHAAFTIPLAQFLFVDAWDCFEGKGFKIFVTGYKIAIRIPEKPDECFSPINFLYPKDYPSRLHAMAAACQYMWEQEKKTNER